MIVVRTERYSLKIYFEGILHLSVRYKEIVGVSSWIDNENLFTIEFSFKDGAKVICEYVDRNIWEEVLEKIDLELTKNT